MNYRRVILEVKTKPWFKYMSRRVAEYLFYAPNAVEKAKRDYGLQ